MVLPAENELARGIDLQHFSGIGDAAVGNLELPCGAGLPLAFLYGFDPELAREFGFGERAPEFLRRGADIGDVNKFGISHRCPPPVSISVRPARADGRVRICQSSARRFREWAWD